MQKLHDFHSHSLAMPWKCTLAAAACFIVNLSLLGALFCLCGHANTLLQHTKLKPMPASLAISSAAMPWRAARQAQASLAMPGAMLLGRQHTMLKPVTASLATPVTALTL